MINDIQKMKELINKNTEANEAYFQKDEPIMTDREYDSLVLELTILEKQTGIHFSNSPIGKVPADAKAGLETVKHSKPMLSCNKTKSMEEFVDFLKVNDAIISWKIDGLTLVLRYENGKFKQAVTRGSDGIIGEDVTHTVKEMRNVPWVVECKENFEVRGEGVISWNDFDILSKLGVNNSHPRNVASGAVRSLVADLGKLSHMDFIAFELIKENAPPTKTEQLEFLKSNNFSVVPYSEISKEEHPMTIAESIDGWVPNGFPYPVDGIVAEYNDIEFGKSLGATAHHEKRMLALKWKDEVKETVFRGVDFYTTRTGKVSIVGLFDEVLIDGTRIHRANLHNLSNFEKYKFGEGDRITVYKANMIIPQIAENKTRRGGYELPRFCPSCGETLEVRVSPSGVKDLYCPNEDCIARNAQKIARYCDKSAMNIEGLSTNTIESLMAYGWIKNFKDLYHLDIHKEDIINAPGFNVDRYNLIHDSIESSRNCFMNQFLNGLGIAGLGNEAAKILHQYYFGSMEAFVRDLEKHFPLSHIEGISPTLERKVYEWYDVPSNVKNLNALMVEVSFKGITKPRSESSNGFQDCNVVVTGTFSNFTREGITDLLTALGARVSDSVEDDTDYVIYGAMPGSKKVGMAIKKGISMLSETKFAEMLDNWV